MYLGSSKLNIVGSKGPWLSVTDPNTYHQFLCQEFLLSDQSTIEKYQSLIQEQHSEMMPVVHSSKTKISTFMILIKPYDMTLLDLKPRAGTFKNEELINTLEQILNLLDGLRKKDKSYGMLNFDTICFCNGTIKLTYGLQTQIKQNQSSLQTDLLSLGKIMLQLTIGPTASKSFLKRISQQYSNKLFTMISLLLHQTPHKRLDVFNILKQDQPQQLPKIVPILQTSNKQSEHTFQYFKNKINKVDEVVNQKLQKIKKIIARNDKIKKEVW